MAKKDENPMGLFTPITGERMLARFALNNIVIKQYPGYTQRTRWRRCGIGAKASGNRLAIGERVTQGVTAAQVVAADHVERFGGVPS